MNEYVLANDSIAEPGEFVFEDYQAFKAFVSQERSRFVPEVTTSLKDILSNKKVSDEEVKSQLAKLAAEAEVSHKNDIDTYKTEILREIEIEIISRYYYQGGKAKHKLNGDSEIQEAINILNDQARYKKILS